MKLENILENIAAEVYNKNTIKIKYIDVNQTNTINIVSTVKDLLNGTLYIKYPQIRRHLKMVADQIRYLDRKTKRIFNIKPNGWDIYIDLPNRNITIKNDQGQIIKQIRI